MLLDGNLEMWVVPSARPKKKRKGRPYQQIKIRIRKIMTNSNEGVEIGLNAWDYALHLCKGNTQKLCCSTKLRRLSRPAKLLHSAKLLLHFALRAQPHCSALCIQLHWFVHASPPPVCRTLRTLLFMVPLLFIIIVSCHSAHPCGFLYMYLHQHGIPILSSSDPLLGALIM